MLIGKLLKAKAHTTVHLVVRRDKSRKAGSDRLDNHHPFDVLSF